MISDAKPVKGLLSLPPSPCSTYPPPPPLIYATHMSLCQHKGCYIHSVISRIFQLHVESPFHIVFKFEAITTLYQLSISFKTTNM